MAKLDQEENRNDSFNSIINMCMHVYACVYTLQNENLFIEDYVL